MYTQIYLQRLSSAWIRSHSFLNSQDILNIVLNIILNWCRYIGISQACGIFSHIYFLKINIYFFPSPQRRYILRKKERTKEVPRCMNKGFPSIHLNLYSFFQFSVLFYLLDRYNVRDREVHLPPADLLLTCLKQPRLDQSKARNQKLNMVSHMDVGDPTA